LLILFLRLLLWFAVVLLLQNPNDSVSFLLIMIIQALNLSCAFFIVIIVVMIMPGSLKLLVFVLLL